tara:strand:+ start:5531 stop:6130 length:600 start_codon:yes stop_codon:yes gene_type:complete
MSKEDPSYVFFLLTGIIGMTIATDGIFVIGPLIKEYYSDGLIRYLLKKPSNILLHFIGVVLSRMIVLSSIVVILIIVANLLFGCTPVFKEIVNIYTTIVIGFLLFSFTGLSLSFASIKNKGGGRDLSNFFYFIVLFVSDTFYPVSELNPTIARIANLLPLNPLLELARGEGFNFVILIWMSISLGAFYFFFNKINFNRK